MDRSVGRQQFNRKCPMDRKMQFTGKEMQVVTKQKKMLNFPPNYASQSYKERALFACQIGKNFKV